MKLKLISAKENITTAKVGVRKSGDIGFGKDAEILLDLSILKFIAIHQNEDKSDKNLYFEVMSENETHDYFKINKAGEFYFLKTKVLMDKLGVDYKNTNITNIFDITPVVEVTDRKLFRLTLRVIEKTKKVK